MNTLLNKTKQFAVASVCAARVSSRARNTIVYPSELAISNSYSRPEGCSARTSMTVPGSVTVRTLICAFVTTKMQSPIQILGRQTGLSTGP